MKVLSTLLFSSLLALRAQTPAMPPAPTGTLPDLPDDSVICVLDDGAKLTMGEFRGLYAALPPNMQQMALSNRPEFLHEYSLMRKLSRMAEEKKLDQESPYKEALVFSRMMVLWQAAMMDINNATTVEPAEIVKFYDANKEKYKTVKVKAIYIPYGSAAKGKKPLTEDEAKAKAAKLAASARAGGDFVKLVKENSEDETSRAKDGDFATFRVSDNIPDAIRSAVFALKQGETSEPVGQPNGFYVFRSEELTYRPMSQVRDEIYSEIKNQRYKAEMDRLNTEANVKSINPAFLGNGKPSPVPAK
jgi:peptidyl-prolyl cis-trans isomerase C